jgi:phage-related minor tail protein
MSETRKIQLETGVDASGAKQGFEEVKQGARDMAQAVAQAGQTAGKGLDAVGDGAKRAGDGLTRAESTIRNSLQRATFELQNFGKTASQKFEAKIDFVGADASKLQPYVAALKQAEAAQISLAQQQKASAFTEGLQAEIAALRERTALQSKSAEEAIRYKAAQAGVTRESVEPLIAELGQLRAAHAAVTQAAQEQAAAERAAAAAITQRDSFVSRVQTQANSIGKSQSDLLAEEAALQGVSAQLAPYIARIREAEQGTRAFGASAKATGIQHQIAAVQVKDFFEQVVSGGSPIRAFAQQGAAVVSNYGGFSNTISALTGLITPFRLAIAGAAAGVGLLAFAMLEGQKQSKAYADAIRLSGNFAGQTEEQFNAMARAVAAAKQTTVGNAREIGQALASSGQIGPENFEKATAAALGLSKATGKTAAQVASDFAKMSESPTKFAEEANKQLNFLTGSQFAYIKALEERGRSEQAAGVIIDALNERFPKTQTHLNGITEALTKGQNAWTQFWDKAIAPATVDDRIAQVQERINRLRQAQALPGASTLIQSSEAELSDLRNQRTAGERVAAQKAADDAKSKNAITGQGLIDGLLKQAKTPAVVKQQNEELTRAFASNADTLGPDGKPKYSAADKKAAFDQLNKQPGGRGSNEAQQVALAQAKADEKQIQDLLERRKDAFSYTQQFLQGAYEAGDLSLKEFFDRQRETTAAGVDAQIAAFEERKARLTKLLADPAFKDPSQRVAVKGQIEDITEEEKRARQQAAQSFVLSNQREAATTKQLNDEVLNYRANLRQLAGDEAGAARIRNELADQQDKIFAAKAAESGNPISAVELAAGKKGRDDQIALNDIKQQTSILNQRLQIEEERIALAQSTGAIGEIEALTREGAARASVVGKMEDQLRALEKLSQERPEDLQLKVDVEGFRLQVDKLKSALDPLKDKFDNLFKDAGTNFFTDLMNGTRPKDALKNFAASISREMNATIGKELSQQVFGKGGLFGGAGGSLADLFGGKDRKKGADDKPTVDTSGVQQSFSTLSTQGIDPTISAFGRLQSAIDSAANSVGSGATSPSRTTGDFARLDRGQTPAVEAPTAGDFARLDRGQTSGEQSVLDMFRDASKSSDTLSASNTQAASTVLQLARAASSGGGALSALPSIIQSIIAATSATSASGAAAGGGGLFGAIGSLFGGSSASGAVNLGTVTGADLALVYKSGGYTGDTDPRKAAGVVHGKEYVFSAPAVQAIGLDRLERLHTKAKTGRVNEEEVPGYADGGYVTVPGSTRPQTLQREVQWLMAQPVKAGDTYITHHHNYPVTVHAPPSMSRQTAMQAGKDVGRGIELARKRQG